MAPSMLPSIQWLDNGATHLLVDGQPFLLRAGELHNSSLSSSAYMDNAWTNLKEIGLNTVLGSVAWEQIESREGHFDFRELDSVIAGARSHDLKLVILWFGAYKNGNSTYVPGWVKTNTRRFPRARILADSKNGTDSKTKAMDVNSMFGTELLAADIKAFEALTSHLSQVDPKGSTVIMVQVENECGLLGDSRDRSPAAVNAFGQPVPDELVNTLLARWDSLSVPFKANFPNLKAENLVKQKTWTDVFGVGARTDELFMAYHYSKYIDTVAAAGKAKHPLPMFANAWLANDEDGDSNDISAGGGTSPGVYPSGGPVPAVLDLWQLFTPSLDFIAPDIHLMDYEKTCESYSLRGQPLFIPEQRRDEYGAIRLWSAIGAYGALGVSPFGIDSVRSVDCAFTKHYQLLATVTPQILVARTEGRRVYGFHFDSIADAGQQASASKRTVDIGQWSITIERAHVFGVPEVGYGLIIELGGDEFLLVGEGFQATFNSTDPKAVLSGLLKFTEQNPETGQGGAWKNERWFNGDEAVAVGGRSTARMPSTNPDYGDFCISILLPARTRIAKVQPYYIVDDL